MLKHILLIAALTSACAVDADTSSVESLGVVCEPGCDCEPPPGPTCLVKGDVVDLDSLEANVDNDDSKVSFCHATGSSSNPYILITTDVEGCNGHADHDPGGNTDIFPTGGCAD
jgi:hypothetical protein